MPDSNGQVTIEDVKQLLGDQVAQFSNEELQATVDFVNRNGGVSHAMSLLSGLDEVRKAA
jgi:hypothetical protein